MKKVYVCSPYRARTVIGRWRNVVRARGLCRSLFYAGFHPVAPHLYYPRFIDDGDEAERAAGMAFAKGLLDGCDYILVAAGRVSEGMAEEIIHAEARGIPRYGEA